MPNDYPPNSAARRKAKALNAQDATYLLAPPLPVVLSHMTPSQINQVQKVLDAAVVNPVVKKEAQDLYRRSVTHRAVSVYTVDEKTERRGDRAMEGMIWVKEDDKHIRLDFEKLLAKDALEPITDNPDEADYLKKVRNTLKEKGVWLRITQRSLVDPRNFEVWLSLGYDGDAIPTGTGLLDRDAILGTTLFDVGYIKEVTQGKVQKTLESLIYSLELDIEDGEREHNRLIRRYEDAFPGVAEISDAIGGADLPGRSIWAYSKKLMSNAHELNKDGNIMGSQAFLLVAAVAVREAALLLSTYAEKSSDGAGSVVKVLEVAKTAGEIAQMGLVVGDAVAVVRGATAVNAAVEKVASKWAAEHPEFAAELNLVGRLNSPKGSVAGGVKPGTSLGAGTGWSKW